MDFKVLLKNRWLLGLGVLGLLCLLVGSIWNGKPAATPTLAPVQTDASVSGTSSQTNASSPLSTDTINSIETTYANQMQGMLSKLMGVNHVSVLVSVSTTNRLSLASTDRTTTDSTTSGGKETHRMTTTDSQPFTESVGGNSVPVVISSTSPQVNGVLVMVNAQDFYVAKAEIIDAITNVWDVPAYNISVEPEK